MPALSRSFSSTSSRLVSRLRRALLSGALPLFVACGGDLSLSADVEVLVDPAGVPHVYARSDADAMLASGYMIARMRLFQLEMVRRQAWGRQAELLGEDRFAQDAASRTLGFARHGIASRTRMEREFPEYAALIQAFVRGINLHIDRVKRGDEPLPPEFAAGELNHQPERFTDDDPYVIGKMLSLGMSNALDSEILSTLLATLSPAFADFPLSMPVRPAFTMPSASQILPVRAPGERDPALPANPPQDRASILRELARYRRIADTTASNNWAVAGRYTANGKPLLAGDPHQPLRTPNRFFAQHLSSVDGSGRLDVIGFAFAGTPGVQLGHNRHVAWTATTNFADVLDLWRVQTQSRDGQEQAQIGKAWVPVQRRSETIRVRSPGGPPATSDGIGSARIVSIGELGEYGVFLPDEMLPVARFLLVQSNDEILVRWTGQAATTEASMYLGLDFADGLEAWDAAARRLEVGAVNLIAADSRSIRYRVHANVPRRSAVKSGSKPWMIMDGRDEKTLWDGALLSDDELPASSEPERGYLCSANNDPFGFTADGRVDNDPFYYGNFYDPGDRAARIESELRRLLRDKPGRVSLDDMKALQADVHSYVADDLLPPLFMALDRIGSDPVLDPYKNRPELIALGKRLKDWDRRMARDSTEAVIFFAFAHFATVRAVGDDYGPFLPRLWQAEPAFAYKPLRLALADVPGTTAVLQEGKAAILVAALADAHDWLKRRFATPSPDSATHFAWRDVHGARFDHMLGGRWNSGTVPVDGSVGTVNVSSSAMADDMGKPVDRFSSDAGSLYRMVVGFDERGAPQAQINFPLGNDGTPTSRFARNQHEAWQNVQYAPLRFHRSDVEADAALRLRIKPTGQVE